MAFRSDIVYSGGSGSFLLNLLAINQRPALALGHLGTAVMLMRSSIGIPLAPQALKLARLELTHLGSRIVPSDR